jgi:hypothetical protein
MSNPVAVPTPAIAPESGPLPSGTKVRHLSLTNGSGLHRVAESLAKAETAMGLDSVLLDTGLPFPAEDADTADVFVIHSHFPPIEMAKRKKGSRIVWVGHGTPDHTYQSSVEAAEHGTYGHSDALMLMQHWLKTADARITFWDRHKWFYDQMLTTGSRPTDCIPMGVDTAFWRKGETRGKFSGEPSLFYAENPHYIKWVYDLMVALPTIAKDHPGLMLHAIYQVKDHHRALFPLANAMGASFQSHIFPGTFDQEGLRNAFLSTDYAVGLVRYGDLNHLSLQANAVGAKTISYAGNPHAMYWVTEGDQREIAREMSAILAGDVEPRVQTPVPDVAEMAQAMVNVYTEIL